MQGLVFCLIGTVMGLVVFGGITAVISYLTLITFTDLGGPAERQYTRTAAAYSAFLGVAVTLVVIFVGAASERHDECAHRSVAPEVVPQRDRYFERWSCARAGIWMTGPEAFIGAVHHVFEELASRTPARLHEVRKAMPLVVYDPECLRRESPRAAARSDGIFAVDGSDYRRFRWIYLHEVGHSVHGWGAGEAVANAYADLVTSELDRQMPTVAAA